MTPEQMATTHAAAFTQSRPWTAEEFAGLLANRFTHRIGDAHSFALFQVIGDEAELLTIATHPDWQRTGLASQLMTGWHQKAVGLRANRAFLEVAADNAPALRLYRRFGYNVCGTRNSYYKRKSGEKVDATVMERRLP